MRLNNIQKIKLLFRLKKKMKKRGFNLTLLLLNKIIPKNKINSKTLAIKNDLNKFTILENGIDDLILPLIMTTAISPILKTRSNNKIKIKNKSKNG